MSDSSTVKHMKVSYIQTEENSQSFPRHQKDSKRQTSQSNLTSAQTKISNRSLREYTNPAALVTLQYTNRREQSIADISMFKNLVLHLSGRARS